MAAGCAAKPRPLRIEDLLEPSIFTPDARSWVDRLSEEDLALVLPSVVRGVVEAGYLPWMGRTSFRITRDYTGEMGPRAISHVTTLGGSYLKMGAGTSPIIVGYVSNEPSELAAFYAGGTGIVADGSVTFVRRSGTLERYPLARDATNIFACLDHAASSAEARSCRTVRLRAVGIESPQQRATFRKLGLEQPIGTVLWLVVARMPHHPRFPNRLCDTFTEPLAVCASTKNLYAQARLSPED